MAGIVIHERILTENKMCEKIGNDCTPNEIIKKKEMLRYAKLYLLIKYQLNHT